LELAVTAYRADTGSIGADLGSRHTVDGPDEAARGQIARDLPDLGR
jgi:hypothetical protein